MGRYIRPLKNKIIVQQDPPKEKVGSLFLPQNSRELYDDYGTVVAVGGDVKEDIKIGDRVLFQRQPGSALNPDKRDGASEWDNLLVLDENNIVAVITE